MSTGDQEHAAPLITYLWAFGALSVETGLRTHKLKNSLKEFRLLIGKQN